MEGKGRRVILWLIPQCSFLFFGTWWLILVSRFDVVVLFLSHDIVVMNHQFSNLFVDQGVQVKYARISTAMNKDSIAEKLKMLADFDLNNFFILGSNKNIKKVLESANEMGMNVGKYSWFAGTKVV